MTPSVVAKTLNIKHGQLIIYNVTYTGVTLNYHQCLIPENTWFIGYARSHLSMAELRSRIQPFLKVGSSWSWY